MNHRNVDSDTKDSSVHRCPDPLDLARFVDGRSSQAEFDRIQIHVSCCNECVELIEDARAAVDGEIPVMLPPKRVYDAARALHERIASDARIAREKQSDGEERTARHDRKRSSFAGWTLLSRAAAVAAVIAVCVAGHQVGIALNDGMFGSAMADDALISEMSFGLFGEPALLHNTESDFDELFVSISR